MTLTILVTLERGSFSAFSEYRARTAVLAGVEVQSSFQALIDGSLNDISDLYTSNYNVVGTTFSTFRVSIRALNSSSKSVAD